MNFAKPIWAVVSLGLAFGLNTQLRPRVEPAYEKSEPMIAQGTLQLSAPELALETLSAHVVIEDVEHLGKLYHVRELSLRSLRARERAPSFELFAALPESLGASGRTLTPESLLQLELAVQSSGRLGARGSFIQRTKGAPEPVLAGSCQFTDIREVWDTGKLELRAEARLELQVAHERGVQLLTGKWSGRLLLD